VCKKKRKRFLLKELFVELDVSNILCTIFKISVPFWSNFISYCRKNHFKANTFTSLQDIWVIALSDLLYIKIYSWRYQLGFKLKENHKKIIFDQYSIWILIACLRFYWRKLAWNTHGVKVKKKKNKVEIKLYVYRWFHLFFLT